MLIILLLRSIFAVQLVCAAQNVSLHPVSINGKHFVDSVTNDRFFLRGIDYQPGGSAAYDRHSDPLSDTEKCARDVYLMQQLGVNTVRVYTVNPKLNHDDCMTMLAAANIYLVLDVNSPLVSESINRYEPWTTYTPEYLRHVFEVVDQFSRYNNTLGFFIGNEIVNDERSASVSPPYIRAVLRDVKDYMYYNCPRIVPLGYSAADDLRYRTQLPNYLACGDLETAVDFYGVNSYQWCGNQTIETSGYSDLIDSYKPFKIPIFFSEFGCNHVQPRLFQEVEALFSPYMTPVFDGGLAYEFSQEPNDYGLVQFDSQGNAHLLDDFYALQQQFLKISISETGEAADIPINSMLHNASTQLVPLHAIDTTHLSTQLPNQVSSRSDRDNTCLPIYDNLNGARNDILESFGTDMIRNGVRSNRGSYNPSILANMPVTSFDIYDINGKRVANPQIKVVNSFDPNLRHNWGPRGAAVTSSKQEKSPAETKRKERNQAPASSFSWRFLGSLFVLVLQALLL